MNSKSVIWLKEKEEEEKEEKKHQQQQKIKTKQNIQIVLKSPYFPLLQTFHLKKVKTKRKTKKS